MRFTLAFCRHFVQLEYLVNKLAKTVTPLTQSPEALFAYVDWKAGLKASHEGANPVVYPDKQADKQAGMSKDRSFCCFLQIC